jgi:hypothetical protein
MNMCGGWEFEPASRAPGAEASEQPDKVGARRWQRQEAARGIVLGVLAGGACR